MNLFLTLVDTLIVFGEWIGTWPGWVRFVMLVVVTPVMVGHFLLWAMWRLGWLDEDVKEDHAKILPFHRGKR